MSSEQLLQEQLIIHSEIDRVFQNLVNENIYDSSKIGPIKDGVTDIEAYCDPKNTPRIMWILKEPWDEIIDGEPYGGDFDITQVQQDPLFMNSISYTQKRIIYSMQSIRTRGKEQYDDMLWYYEMPQHLTGIAYINLSKMPGYPSTDAKLEERAKYWKEIVKKQVYIYEPDVIITGNIMPQIEKFEIFCNLEYLGNEQGLVNVYRLENGRLVFDVYHPSYFRINTKVYTESLANAINKYFFQQHKV